MENYVSEVRRIIESPYAVCLKKLHDCLADSDRYDLQLWAECNGCQLDALAAKILEGLQVGPYALKLIQHLSCVPEIRDAILRQEPMLLDTLLSRANESESGYERYAEVCLSLVSFPLQAQVPIPASLPPFTVMTLEMAIREPSAVTIRPLYQILSGMGYSLLEMLSDDTIKHLQEKLKDMLKTLGNHFDSLLCLAIFAHMVSVKTPDLLPSDNATTPPGSDRSSEKITGSVRDRHEVARQFLNHKKASKTLELVVLRVILICSINCPLDHGRAMDSLRLSKEIIDAIDETEKRTWLKRTTISNKKLYEKVLRPDLNVNIRSLALEIIASLSGNDSLPRVLVVAFEKTLTLPVMSYPSDRSIQKYATQFEAPFISTLILNLLNLALGNEALGSKVTATVRSAYMLVRNLTETTKVSDKLRKSILYAVSMNETKAPLQSFLTVQLSQTKVATGNAYPTFCPQHCALGFHQLQQAICILLLTATVYASNDEVGVDSAVASALLEKQVKLSIVPPGYNTCRSPCQYPVVPKVALFEAASTPANTTVSRDWKSRLGSILNRGASLQHEQLTEVVDQVCRDLQSRCDDIERPLREEQSMTGELHHQLQDLHIKYEEAENKVQEQILLAKGLESENSRLVCELQALEQRMKTATEVSKGLQETLEGVRLETERSEQAARGNERKRELEFFTMLTAKTELNDQLASELASQGSQITSLNHEMNSIRSRIAEQVVEINRLEQAGLNATHAIERADKLAESKAAELILSKNNQEAMQAIIANLQLKVEEQAKHHESISSSIAKERGLHDAQRAKLVHEHEEYVLAKTAEISQFGQYQEEIHQDLRIELRRARNEADKVAQCKSSEIVDLRTKVAKLCSEREERAREFAEVQELSSKLMTVMKTKPAHSGMPQTGTRATNQMSEQACCSQHEPMEADHGIGTTRFFSSNTSGPTPKPTRPRRPSKTPSTHQPNPKLKFPTTKLVGGTNFKTKRFPLQEIPSDLRDQLSLSPSKDEFADGTAKLGEGNAYTLDGADLSALSFNESDILTSTERQPPSPLRTAFQPDVDDETTADF